MKKTLKKRLSACLAMLLVISTLLGSMPVTAAAKSGAMKVGSTFTSGQYKYKVTALKGKSGNVSLLGAKNKSITSVTIPNTVKSGKYKFKVTAIADKAFKGYKKLKVVNTNKNLKTIGSNAFNGCKKLEKVNIKGTNVTSVGKNALKGISKKAVIQVPEKKKSAYAGILKNKGQSSSVKVAAVGSAVTSAPQTEAQAAAPQTEVQAAAAQTETQAAVPQTEAKVAVPQKTTEQKATEQAPAQETPQTTEATEEETAKVETEAQTEAQVTEPQTEPETQASESESEAQPELTEAQTTEAQTEATEAQTTEAQTEETKAQATEVQTEVAEIQPAEKDKPQITEPETEPELKTQTEETAGATEKETTEAQTTKAAEEETTEAQTTKAAEEETTEAQTTKVTEEEKTEAQTTEAQTGVTEAQPAETDKQQVTEPETEPESQTAEPESEAQTEKETEAPVAPKAEIPQTYPQKKGLRYAAPPKADETDANVTETEETEPETKATESETEVIETETEVVETETETQATEHVHSYSDWQITKAATCTDAGEMTRTCDECGAVETDVIAVEGHSFGEWGLENIPGSNCYARNVRECTICGYVEKSFAPVHRTDVLENLPDIEPTCTTAGQSNRTKCPYCKQEFFGYVKPLGHEYSEEVTVEESTCVKPGISYRKCIRCDARTDEKEIAKATGHQWEEVSIAASCTETGFEGRRCSICGAEDGKQIKAAGHKYETTIVEAKCGEDGFKDMTCSVCGQTSHTVLPATGKHRWVSYPEVQATCVEDGHTAYTQCSICGKYQDAEPEIFEATGEHHWVTTSNSPFAFMNAAVMNDDDKPTPSTSEKCKDCGCFKITPGSGGFTETCTEDKMGGHVCWILLLVDTNNGSWSKVENSIYLGQVCLEGEEPHTIYESYLIARRCGYYNGRTVVEELNRIANELEVSDRKVTEWTDANLAASSDARIRKRGEFVQGDICKTFKATGFEEITAE